MSYNIPECFLEKKIGQFHFLKQMRTIQSSFLWISSAFRTIALTSANGRCRREMRSIISLLRGLLKLLQKTSLSWLFEELPPLQVYSFN